MLTMNKVREYFRATGVPVEDNARGVELEKDPQSGVVFIRAWRSSVPRPPDAYWATAPDYNPVPGEVTARQFRLALVDAGVTMAGVDAAIAALPDDGTREKAQIEWEYAGGIQRTNPLVLSLAPALGFDTEEKIDDLFRSAKGR